MTVQDKWREWRKRKVAQWAVAYLAAAWLALEGIGLLTEQLSWAPVVFRVALVLFGTGFLATLVLAWFHGEKGAQRVTPTELVLLAGVLVLTGGLLTLVARGPRDQVSTRDQAGASAGGAVTDEAPGRTASPGSIAVLPFRDLSRDQDQEYFSDGITEELLNGLARVPGLRVAARTSSFHFKGSSASVDSIGRALGVVHLLEGSVRKDGDRLRVTAQLIDAVSGTQLWSGGFDGELSDVFAVQDEIARAITEALPSQLGLDTVTPPGRPTEDLQAYDEYLRGLHLANQQLSYDRAREHLERAVELDPGFALAFAALSDAYSHLERPADARQAALRALELDETLAEAHAALAFVRFFNDWNWREGEELLRRALELKPTYALARQRLAYAYLVLGRFDEALTEIGRAQALDPLSVRVLVDRALIHWGAGDLDRSAEIFRQVLELEEDNAFARSMLAWGLARGGRTEEAAEAFEELGDTLSAALVSGDTAAALGLLADQTDPSSPTQEVDPLQVAGAYARLGRDEEALEWLERSYEERHRLLPFIRIREEFDGIRSDPRFRELLERIGLPGPVMR